MVAWVVIHRRHARRAPRQSVPSQFHSGLHLSPISQKIAPFFSCTYVEPILQPVCFHIHACNGGVPPFVQKKRSSPIRTSSILGGWSTLSPLKRVWVPQPCGFQGDDMRQAPPYLGRCMLARIVLEPFGMEPSRRRPCQFISELIFTPVRKPSAGVTRLMA